MKKKQVTLLELAKRLDLSPSTVSRALNGRHRISEETRNRVRALAEKLEYQPNPSAKRLRESKTYVLGVLVPEIAHDFFSTAISGMEDVAMHSGYNLVICQSHESVERENATSGTLLFSRVDGLLFCPSQETKDFDRYMSFLRKDIPVVFFDRFAQDFPASRVVCDDVQGAKDAVSYLIEKGCRRIAHLAAPNFLSNSQDRLNGYLEAHKAAGISVHEDLIQHVKLDQDQTVSLTNALLNRKDPPDAIFCFNDYIAFDVMKIAKAKGLSIPQDLSIVGFSDSFPSSLTEPGLTTVRQPAFEMGKLATKLMLDQLNKDGTDQAPTYQTIKLATKLIIRGSTL
ncbi:MAG: LacI family DNA-binding transcriptional regulator [Bacteroidota bacterium]